MHCTGCGELLPADGLVTTGHGRCEERRAYEPPRFCAECGRRMVVKVTPTSYAAKCSVHGVVHST